MSTSISICINLDAALEPSNRGAALVRGWPVATDFETVDTVNPAKSARRAIAPITIATVWRAASALGQTLLLYTGLATGMAASPAAAAPPAVLALYDGTREAASDETRIHRYAEMPLNHLGFEVIYWDVSRGLPDPVETDCCARILSWFDAPVPDPGALLRWSEQPEVRAGRFVVIGESGQEPDDSSAAQRRLAGLGLSPEGSVVATYRSSPVYVDADFYAFEHPLDPILPSYPRITRIDPGVAAHLVIRDSMAGKDVGLSAVVTTGPHGGYVPSGYALYLEEGLERTKWLLNPFSFFEAAFGEGLRPVPDVTTLSGRRLYFSHIDGDGWNNVSDLRSEAGRPMLASEAVLEKVVDAFPDLPVTVGIVAGDIDTTLGGTAVSEQIARDLLSRPQVETGSHTYTHPYLWKELEQYSRDIELERIAEARAELRRTPLEAARLSLAALLSLDAYRPNIERGISDSAVLPRTYLNRPFDLSDEIAGSLRFASNLSPAGRSAALLQWSGDAEPFAAAVAATREAGVRNMNGGDGRLDQAFDSAAYVPPISRPVGSERQIYAPMGNENLYTNDWTGPFDGQLALQQTIDRTEAPRRLVPIDLYYHMYSGEHEASRNTVQTLLAKLDAASIIPVSAATYAAIADGFFETSITPIGPRRWRVRSNGTLGTVRFDNPDDLSVDFNASRGVVGQIWANNALYVALDTAMPVSIVALTDAADAQKAVPFLRQSRWRVSALERGACGWQVDATGYGSGEMQWLGVEAREYHVTASRAGVPVWERDVEAKGGALALDIEADAIEPLVISFECIPA